jgi:hypothetical protein
MLHGNLSGGTPQSQALSKSVLKVGLKTGLTVSGIQPLELKSQDICRKQ